MADNNQYAPFRFPKSVTSGIIKVIGVGGGGCNAANRLFLKNIPDVSFLVCNTDQKALNSSPIPDKLLLGDGLGAGNRPAMARQDTEACAEKLKALLDDGTKMVFIAAGMGAGTGTGAAPVVAKVARDMGILTVAIVTIPFRWEGNKKIDQALDGVDDLRENVDALLIVNNERLREVYQEKTLSEALALADDTLCNAVCSIVDIINMQGHLGLDFQDVRTVLKDGGVAVMSTGRGAGKGRVSKALDDALDSPLLSDNKIGQAKRLLIHIVEPGPDGEHPLMTKEINEINDFMSRLQMDVVETKWGLSYDTALGDSVKITILASGFASPEGHRAASDSVSAPSHTSDTAQRRRHFYGADNTFHIFQENELDDNEAILLVESIPSIKRLHANNSYQYGR